MNNVKKRNLAITMLGVLIIIFVAILLSVSVSRIVEKATINIEATDEKNP